MKLPPYINGLFLKYQLTINNINTSLAKLLKVRQLLTSYAQAVHITMLWLAINYFRNKPLI